MSGFNGDIAVNSLNIPGAIHHLGIRRTAGISLHHQVIAHQHIPPQVLNTVGKQRQIVTRVQQRGIDK